MNTARDRFRYYQRLAVRLEWILPLSHPDLQAVCNEVARAWAEMTADECTAQQQRCDMVRRVLERRERRRAGG